MHHRLEGVRQAAAAEAHQDTRGYVLQDVRGHFGRQAILTRISQASDISIDIQVPPGQTKCKHESDYTVILWIYLFGMK